MRPWHFRASTSGRYAALFACGTLPLFVVETLTATMEHTTKTNSTQPRSREYSGFLDLVAGVPHLALLSSRSFQSDVEGNSCCTPWTQAFFKPDDSTTIRPTASEQELMRSLPYQ